MSDVELLTSDYKQQLQQKHQTSPWGGGGWHWIPEIVKLMIEFRLGRDGETPTILDYGCGRRTFSETMKWLMPHVAVTEYDPGVVGFDKVPLGTFDLVLCTDVMEHVEEQFVAQTFQRLADYARHAVFFNIALTPARSTLPNGRNAHITIHNENWWMHRVSAAFKGDPSFLPGYKHFTFVARKNPKPPK